MDKARNGEIDILLVLKILSNGKWKIFSFILIFFTISLAYKLFTQDAFRVSSVLQKSNQSLYLKYKYLNDILMRVTLRTKIETDSGFTPNEPTKEKFLNISYDRVLQIDGNLIFKMFFDEFRDYEEMITVLSKNDYVIDKIKNLSDKEKQKSLIGFAKNFTITKPQKKGDDWQLSFVWHQINEGTSLFDNALKLTLINVQKSLLMEIEKIANSIDLDNQRIKNSLNIKLQSNRKLNKLINARRMSFLIEQSKIAKELGIMKNQSINMSISQSNVSGSLHNQLNDVNYFDNAYFLRGYKAIDREIQLMKSRSDLENDLMTKDYIKIQKKLLDIQGDVFSKEIRDAKEIIKNDDIANWIKSNLELAEIKNAKNSKLFILISTIIGALLGSFYVLISNSFRQIK